LIKTPVGIPNRGFVFLSKHKIKLI
jgi:hypothetical protein